MSVSVALLLARFGSLAPAGTETVTPFVNAPVAVASTVPVTANVADPPTPRLTVEFRLPVPLAAAQDAAGAQVQLTLVSAAGMLSTTVAPATAVGPALLTVIV